MPISILITSTLGTEIPAKLHMSFCMSGITVNGSTCKPRSELNKTPHTTANTPPIANTAESRLNPLSRARFFHQIKPPPSIIISP